jgi:hypothetical protein
MKTLNKIIIAVVVLALIGLIIKFSNSKKVENIPEPEKPVVIENDESIGTFSDNDFSFQYKKDLIAKDYNETSSWRGNTQTEGEFHVGILIPSSVQPNTNFREAKFTVGLSSDSVALTECLIPTNGERAKGEVTINGVVFKKITLTDAGAGNYYDTTSYRAVHNEECYAVEYTIHSTNLRNYSPDQNIQEFDTPFIVQTLESMAQSFKFK